MHVDVVEGQNAFDRLRGNWDAVYEADPEAQFFLSWPWISKWLSTVNGPWFILAAKPSADAPNYVAFLPLRLRTKERRDGEDYGFYNAINMAGNYGSDYTGFICSPQFEGLALPALAEHLKRLNWARLHLEYFRASEKRTRLFLAPFLQKRFRLTESTRINPDKINNLMCPSVPLPGDWDSYLATLSANTRQKARRFLRAVETSGELRITYSSADTAERDVKTLLRFWTKQWGARKGTRLKSILQSNFTMLTHSLKTGTLFMPMLWNGETPVGVLATFIDRPKKSLLFYIGSRDETFEGPPAGFVLHTHSIRYAIDNGFTTYDFLRGNEAYKYSFGAKDRFIRCIEVATSNKRNLGGRLDRRSVPIVLGRAGELHQENKVAEAERGYRQVLDVEPDNVSALYGMGKLAAARGDHVAGTRFFKSVLSAGTDSFKVWFRLAKSLEARERFAEAADAYRDVIAREPGYAPAHSGLGGALRRLRRFDEAAAAFETALTLRPDDFNAQCSWTSVMKEAGTAAPAKYADYASLNTDVADKMTKAGAVDFAIACYRQSLEMKPDLVKAHRGLALALHAKGDIEGAAQSHRNAMQLDPHHREVPGMRSPSYPSLLHTTQ